MRSTTATSSEAFPTSAGCGFNLTVLRTVIDPFNGIRSSRNPGEKKVVFSSGVGNIQFIFRRKVHFNVLRFLHDDDCQLLTKDPEGRNQFYMASMYKTILTERISHAVFRGIAYRKGN